jgi:hypothetical protein
MSVIRPFNRAIEQLINNKMKNIATFGTLLLINISFAFAQDFKKDMRAMYEEYKSMNSVHIMMEVSMFSSKESTQPFYSMPIDIRKENDNYLYKYGQNDMLMNDQYLVMVDRGSKEIIYSKRDVVYEKQMKKNFNVNIDSVMATNKDAEYIETKDGIHHYRMKDQTGDIKVLDLYIQKDSKLLNGLIYEYKNNQVVTIEFKKFEKVAAFVGGTFDEKQYVILVKNKFTPASGFKNYHVLTPQLTF